MPPATANGTVVLNSQHNPVMKPPALEIHPLSHWFPMRWAKALIGGPCGAESYEQVMTTARALAASGKVSVFRAGVWKPRTRPGAFEGKGEEALRWLQDVKKETGLLTTVEVATAAHAELALQYGIDILWIGARTTVNPFSVQDIADVLQGTDVPVLVKNPVNPDLHLWLGALERMNRAGVKKLGAIHRGFSTSIKTQYRNAPLWEIPIELKGLCPELPLFCDPSHIGGQRAFLHDIAQRALDLHYDGLMIESHPDPATAWSDADQQVTPAAFDELIDSLIVREAQSGDTGFTYMLSTLRQVIDEIDDELLRALARRMEVVERIGEYKKGHNVTILQIQRWLEIVKSRTATGLQLGLEEETILELCQLLHKASIKRQTEVMRKK